MIDDEMATEYIKAYFNWLDVVEPLTDDETGRLFKALLAYGKDGTIPDWVGNERYAFYALKINIDNNQKAYDRDVENGKRGGRPRVQTETPKGGVIEEKPPVLDEKPPVFETKGGVSEENQEKKRKEKIREEKKEDISKLSGKADDVTEIIDYLNEVCGTHYKPNTPETVRLIRARLKEGFSVEDFNRVIDTMYAKWGSNGDMARYLRPQTLFGTKFESYLNMAAVQTTAQSTPSAPINKLGFENYTPDPSKKDDLYARAIEMLEAAEKG